MPAAGVLSQVEHSVLLHAFGLHGTTRASDAEIAELYDLTPQRVVETRQAGVSKMLQFARSNRERFRAIAELLEGHPELPSELLQQLVPPVLSPKPPRPKRVPAESFPAYVPKEREYGQAVWDEALRAKVVLVSRALLDRDGIHEFDTGCPGVLRFYVCRGGVWPSPYPIGIYWYPDDRHTGGINWENPQKPLRTTIGGEPLVVAYDDASEVELASAQLVEPFEWKDD